MIRRLSLTFTLAICLAQTLSAQSQIALAPDSNELFDTFFVFQDGLRTSMDDRKVKDGASASVVDSDVSRLLKVTTDDVTKVNAIAQTVVADLKKIDKEYIEYANARAKWEQFPEPKMIQQFSGRRQAVVQAGVDRLKRELSPASWQGLRDYVNNTHRKRFRSANLTAK